MHGILAKRIPGSCNVRAKSNCCWIRSTLFSASRSSSPVSQRHGNFLRDNLTYSPGLLGFCCLFNRATRDALAATSPLSTRTPDSRRSLKLPGRAAVEWKSIVSFYHTFSFFDLRGLPLHFFIFSFFIYFARNERLVGDCPSSGCVVLIVTDILTFPSLFFAHCQLYWNQSFDF